ncbi:hypothetical protein GPL15_06195 [Clostridium sp. MCC353]|uniref:tripartite tricarboxylate transporter TctB family protein n=1 Tax=Clostridium sp. MCC353 TaxID=2592646 RepID=UPI001C02CD2C|nr:tripartite tricarboxylate transporter TctB family protein [Clostridium sp. MCC353]MBT9776094.1 hypothetical protein [Clostridium sp. MCC353]
MNRVSALKKINNHECRISIAIFILGLCILVPSVRYNPGVRLFPVLTGACFIVIGAGNLVLSLKKDKEEPDKTVKLLNRLELLIFFIMGLTAALIKILGFYVSLYLCMLGVCFLVIKRDTFKKTLISNAVFCLAAVAVLFVIFHLILHIPTPAGLLI